MANYAWTVRDTANPQWSQWTAYIGNQHRSFQWYDRRRPTASPSPKNWGLKCTLVLSNFEWPYLHNGSSDPLHVSFYGSWYSWVGGSNGAISGLNKFKMAAGCHLGIIEWSYLRNGWSGPLHVGGSNDAISGSIKSRMAAGRHFGRITQALRGFPATARPSFFVIHSHIQSFSWNTGHRHRQTGDRQTYLLWWQ